MLLLVHGGPGDVQSPYVSTYAPYEKGFVLVQWDQRSAGRTLAKNGAAGVSQARLIADGLDLARQLNRRFARQKLFVLGHSWGSVVATGMVQRRPELFDAYVGAALGFADMAGASLRFALPDYVIQGRDDVFSPTPLAETYFRTVQAPAKRLVVIEGAGLFALATHQADVIAALRQLGR